MCLTCDNLERDLTASGSIFNRFRVLHHPELNVVDIFYNTGSALCKNNIDRMINCLRGNRYACERISIWNVITDCFVDLHKVRDTRICEIRVKFLYIRLGSWQSLVQFASSNVSDLLQF
jgi:hypothetical protein